MFGFDDVPARPANCPQCKSVQPVRVIESLNFGNLLACCDTCETEWDFTKIDGAFIWAETEAECAA